MTAQSQPITLVAHLNDIAVFQTRAFNDEPNVLFDDTSTLGQASYGDFNLGLHVSDDPKPVLHNRMQLLSAINEQLKGYHLAPIARLHWVNQVHGNQVHDIDNTTIGMQPIAADAMVSMQDDMGLAIMTADCVPIVMYQPDSRQIAAIHAGWQGLACGVIKQAAKRFDKSLSIMAWMGACISQAHYEVNRQVQDKLLAGCFDHKLLDAARLNEFEHLYSIASEVDVSNDATANTNLADNSQSAEQYLHKNLENLSNYATVNADKIKLNLPQLAADQLTALGIKLKTDLPIDCSYADTRYYSYRRQTHLHQPATGRMALIIVRSRPL
ncbi:polyphenol oxidase family protein [Psychrobacter sp. DM8]|uniref:polyphenol oxidase family protein n=1 Tax=unclassified Psychrobacter TaxID=196806 RepID=UPI003F4F4D05